MKCSECGNAAPIAKSAAASPAFMMCIFFLKVNGEAFSVKELLSRRG